MPLCSSGRRKSSSVSGFRPGASTRNCALHEGQRTRLPTVELGTEPRLPHFGHLALIGTESSLDAPFARLVPHHAARLRSGGRHDGSPDRLDGRSSGSSRKTAFTPDGPGWTLSTRYSGFGGPLPPTGSPLPSAVPRLDRLGLGPVGGDWDVRSVGSAPSSTEPRRAGGQGGGGGSDPVARSVFRPRGGGHEQAGYGWLSLSFRIARQRAGGAAPDCGPAPRSRTKAMPSSSARAYAPTLPGPEHRFRPAPPCRDPRSGPNVTAVVGDAAGTPVKRCWRRR